MVRALLLAVVALGLGALGHLSGAAATPGPGALDYQLTAFDSNTLTLQGVSFLDTILPPNPISPGDPYRVLDASLNTGTSFRSARLDAYNPADPCRALAESYNTVVTSDGYSGSIGSMVTQGCNARVIVDLTTSTIRSFQPVAAP